MDDRSTTTKLEDLWFTIILTVSAYGAAAINRADRGNPQILSRLWNTKYAARLACWFLNVQDQLLAANQDPYQFINLINALSRPILSQVSNEQGDIFTSTITARQTGRLRNMIQARYSSSIFALMAPLHDHSRLLRIISHNRRS